VDRGYNNSNTPALTVDCRRRRPGKDRAQSMVAETRLRGGRCHVDQGAVGDRLRAGVAEDDLPEKALGAFCVPKGLARSRATGGRRNGIYGGDPLCGEQAVYAGFALPLTESKPARRQPGEHCRRQCGGVATHGTIQPPLRGVRPRTGSASGTLSRLVPIADGRE
jgi:hypothetical protein